MGAGRVRGRATTAPPPMFEERSTSASNLFWEVLRTTTQVEPVPALPKAALRSSISLPKIKHQGASGDAPFQRARAQCLTSRPSSV